MSITCGEVIGAREVKSTAHLGTLRTQSTNKIFVPQLIKIGFSSGYLKNRHRENLNPEYVKGTWIRNIKLAAHWVLFMSNILRQFLTRNKMVELRFVLLWKGMRAQNVELTMHFGAFHFRHFPSKMNDGGRFGVMSTPNFVLSCLRNC